MSPPKSSVGPILRREAVGFSLITALCWVVELLQIPQLLFDEPTGFNWLRVLFRTAVVLAIWAWVHFTTKRLLARLHHLEEFLLVCSWCRKLGSKGDWLKMEEYFGSNFDTKTSHGICPACAQEQFADLDMDADAEEQRPGDASGTRPVEPSSNR